MIIKLLAISTYNYDSRIKENRKRAFEAACLVASVLNINNLNEVLTVQFGVIIN